MDFLNIKKKTLEGEIDPKYISALTVIAEYNFPDFFEETIEKYTGELIDHYKNLKIVNPDLSPDLLTQIAYKDNLDSLIQECKSLTPDNMISG